MSHSVSVPPNLLENFESAISGLGQNSLGLVLDFDGTMSEFVPNLENAVIFPDIVPPLRRLVGRLTLVAVMSGRAARDVERRVGIGGIVYVGNHGAECIADGELSAAQGAEAAESDLQALLDTLGSAAADPGIVLENKKFSASVHYRSVADEDAVIERLRAAVDSLPDMGAFQVFWGNKILEIRRRNGVDKGVALDKLMRDWRVGSAVFLGDDTTDADALLALKERRASGDISGFGVAVVQDGTPASVLENADYSLDGVPEVAEFLQALTSMYRMN